MRTGGGVAEELSAGTPTRRLETDEVSQMPTQRPTQRSQARDDLDQLEAELTNAEGNASWMDTGDRARLKRLRERADMVRGEMGATPEKKQ